MGQLNNKGVGSLLYCKLLGVFFSNEEETTSTPKLSFNFHQTRNTGENQRRRPHQQQLSQGKLFDIFFSFFHLLAYQRTLFF